MTPINQLGQWLCCLKSGHSLNAARGDRGMNTVAGQDLLPLRRPSRLRLSWDKACGLEAPLQNGIGTWMLQH